VYDYVVLDVFTRVPLQGNPLAVFLDADGLDGETMQRAARELNLSESVFVTGGSREDADATLRIFTPATELPFAGHPVLGTAFVVGQRIGGDVVRLATGAGVIVVELTREDGEIVFGAMDQPVPEFVEFDAGDDVLRALGVAESLLPVQAYSNGPLHLYVALPDADSVHALDPDITALGRVLPGGVSCFAVGEGWVESRMFGPGVGVAEDPATGSAAGPLAVHLARHGVIAYGEEIEIHQGTAMRRPSVLFARAEGTADRIERVVVGGGAVQVAEGRYRLG
jgi:trans-2,3-dihydro-3-hydroxyanthranilate isomerase